ncbi:MAG: hypothetical protein ACFFC7_02330 [Candidatus Hermodarchaeota archaeon]
MSGLFIGHLSYIRRIRHYFLQHQALTPDSAIELNLSDIAAFCRFSETAVKITLEQMKSENTLFMTPSNRLYIKPIRFQQQFQRWTLISIIFYVITELFFFVRPFFPDIHQPNLPFIERVLHFFLLNLPFHLFATASILILILLWWHYFLR